jgi:hypothetical protein
LGGQTVPESQKQSQLVHYDPNFASHTWDAMSIFTSTRESGHKNPDFSKDFNITITPAHH